MTNFEVFIDDVDITEYIRDLPPAIERISYQQDLITIDDFTFSAFNDKNIFSVGSPSSIFFGKDVSASDFVVKEYDETIWEGKIKNVVRNHGSKIAEITAVSNITKTLNRIVDNYNVNQKTPAWIAKNLLEYFGLSSLIGNTFNRSDAYLTDQAFLTNARFSKENSMSLIDMLQMLADVSCADCYTSDGKIHFEVYEYDRTDFALHTTIEREHILRDSLVIQEITDSKVNDYAITYGTGSTVKDTDVNNLGQLDRNVNGTIENKAIDLSVGNNLVLYSRLASIWLGESYIYRSINPIRRIECNIDKKSLGEYLSVGNLVKFELNAEDVSNDIYRIMEKETQRTSAVVRIVADKIKDTRDL